MPDESHLQDAASNLEAGTAERQNSRARQGLQLASRRSESNVWHSGLPAAARSILHYNGVCAAAPSLDGR